MLHHYLHGGNMFNLCITTINGFVEICLTSRTTAFVNNNILKFLTGRLQGTTNILKQAFNFIVCCRLSCLQNTCFSSFRTKNMFSSYFTIFLWHSWNIPTLFTDFKGMICWYKISCYQWTHSLVIECFLCWNSSGKICIIFALLEQLNITWLLKSSDSDKDEFCCVE